MKKVSKQMWEKEVSSPPKPAMTVGLDLGDFASLSEGLYFPHRELPGRKPPSR